MRQILAVEDSEDAQALIVAALGDDYAVRLAPTLADARQQLESAVPDLVLLDVELPDGSGIQLCSELQAASGTREVPVVFLTSHTATGEKVLAFSLGADDYLDKPFDPLELRRAWRAACASAICAANAPSPTALSASTSAASRRCW